MAGVRLGRTHVAAPCPWPPSRVRRAPPCRSRHSRKPCRRKFPRACVDGGFRSLSHSLCHPAATTGIPGTRRKRASSGLSAPRKCKRNRLRFPPTGRSERAMNRSDVTSVTITVDDAHSVSGLLWAPASARACYVLAHGAGAGMFHPFMDVVARELAERGIATLRYQFSYIEQGARRPDPPKLAHATVRAAVAAAAKLAPALALVAGGKSFGGRMTSQAQAASPLPGVRGLSFLGFPLHPAGRPSDERAEHLFAVEVPMLFLQGSRDKLADLGLLQRLMERLGERASLRLVPDADHSFRVPRRARAPSPPRPRDRAAERWSRGRRAIRARPASSAPPRG